MLFGKKHTEKYRETGGEVGHEWQGTQTLLLTTTGRKSGEARELPLIYAPWDDAYLIVASKGGADDPPAWYLNLEADPEVEVQVMADRFKAKARVATPEEKAEMWPTMTKEWPAYDDYQKKTDGRSRSSSSSGPEPGIHDPRGASRPWTALLADRAGPEGTTLRVPGRSTISGAHEHEASTDHRWIRAEPEPVRRVQCGRCAELGGSPLMTSSIMRAVAGLLVLSAALPAGAQGAESWLQPEMLSTADTHNDAVDLATNSPGVAAAVWTEFANGRTPRFRLRVSTRAIDGAWVSSQQLSGAGEVGAGAVGVDPQGRITVVWDEAGKMMWASHAPGEPWTGAEPIADGDGGNPDLFVASDGTATAVWQKGTTIDTLVIRAARRPPGGAWSSVETISPTWSYRAHVEGDTAGDVTVSYTHDVPGGRYIYAVDRRAGGTWGTQSPLGGPVLADNVSELVVAPNSGQASVFWQNGNLAAPLAARTGLAGAWGPVTPISGSAPGAWT